MENRRVVITGIGAISPAGNSIEDFWRNILSGKTMIHKSDNFDDANFSTNLIAEVEEFDVKKHISNKKLRRMLQKGEMYAMAAAKEAISDSGLKDYDAYEIGLFLGCTKEFGKYSLVEEAFNESLVADGKIDSVLFGKSAGDTIPPLIILESIPNACIDYISEEFNIKGPNTHFMTTGVSSTQAIGTAFTAIKNGDCNISVAGGFDSLNDILSFATFNSVELMTSCREQFRGPFDQYRNGFVLGEGSGILILEELEHARSRKAKIYAEVIGYASNTEAKSLVGLDEKGDSLAQCINLALENANVNADLIDYVNAYASGTQIGDLSETRAIKSVFHLNKDLAVSSIKGTIGHLIGASGGVETIATVLAIKNNTIPPTVSLYEFDDELDLDYVPDSPREKEVNFAIKISRGMGGQNAVLVLKKWEENNNEICKN